MRLRVRHLHYTDPAVCTACDVLLRDRKRAIDLRAVTVNTGTVTKLVLGLEERADANNKRLTGVLACQTDECSVSKIADILVLQELPIGDRAWLINKITGPKARMRLESVLGA